jgi:O-antigen/teichoic acid export membrane protein
MAYSGMSAKSLLIALTPGVLKPIWARLEASPLGYRLARGAFWSLVSGLIGRALGLLASIFVARILGKETFGELGTVQSTVAMFAVFAGFGTAATATKYVAEFRQSDPERARRIIALSTAVAWITSGVAALILFIVSPWLATKTLAAPHLSGTIQVGTLLLFLGGLNGAQFGVLAGFESFKKIAVINFVGGLISFPALLAGAYWNGLTGTVWALVITMLVTYALTRFVLRQEVGWASIPWRGHQWTSEWPVLWKFSLPSILASFMIGPVTWACNAILVNQPDGYLEMGLFSAANQWRMAIIMLPAMVGGVGFPVLSNLLAQSDFAGFRKVFYTNLGVSFGVAAVIALSVVGCAPFIMRSYGRAFAGGEAILIVLSAVAVVGATLDVVGQTIASEGRMWFGFLLNAIWAVVLLGASLLLIPGRGALGMALANLIAYGVHLLTVSIYLFFRLRGRYASARCP